MRQPIRAGIARSTTMGTTPSHGCNGGCWQLPATNEGSGYWNGLDCQSGHPSYMIDHSAVYNRIHPWATYLYNVGG